VVLPFVHSEISFVSHCNIGLVVSETAFASFGNDGLAAVIGLSQMVVFFVMVTFYRITL
jgi:hypothetical protein